MSSDFKENKLKITYEVPLEDINKKLKDDILFTIKSYRTLWNKIKRIFISIFFSVATGVLFGGLFSGTGAFAETIVSAVSDEKIPLKHFLLLSNICAILLAVIVFGVFIYVFITESIFIKKLVQIFDEMDYEAFFEEYNKNKINFFMYDDLTENYDEYKSIMACIDSMVKVKVYDSSLWITSTNENGDIEKTLVNVDKIVQNINIKEPEIRVGYDYKITYLEPYIY